MVDPQFGNPTPYRLDIPKKAAADAIEPNLDLRLGSHVPQPFKPFEELGSEDKIDHEGSVRQT